MGRIVVHVRNFPEPLEVQLENWGVKESENAFMVTDKGANDQVRIAISRQDFVAMETHIDADG